MKYSGFTLIELMIVIAIIACLSMLAVPGLLKCLAKAKRTEAYLYLRTLAQAQRSYYLEHGSYTKNIGSIGWEPEGTFNYTYGFNGGAEGETHFTGALKTPASLLAGASLKNNGFTIYAAGYIYGDKPDILSIDHRNTITVISDALS